MVSVVPIGTCNVVISLFLIRIVLIGEGKLFDEYFSIINAVLWITHLWKPSIFNCRKRGSV